MRIVTSHFLYKVTAIGYKAVELSTFSAVSKGRR